MQAVTHGICKTSFITLCHMTGLEIVHVRMGSEGVWRGLTRPRLVLRCNNWRGYVKLVLAVGPLMTMAAASYALAAWTTSVLF